MNIGELLEIKDFTILSEEELTNISIYNGAASQRIIEGLSVVGTLMFQHACSDNDTFNKDTIRKLSLLIQYTTMIAATLNENSIQSEKELQSRSAPPPCTLRSRRDREIKLLVLLAISIMLSYHYSNLKVIYTKTNQRKK